MHAYTCAGSNVDYVINVRASLGERRVSRETRNVHNASDGIMVLMARINPCVLADNNSPLTAADFYLGHGVCNVRELHVDGMKGLG